MASPRKPRRLFELLEEQQEPLLQERTLGPEARRRNTCGILPRPLCGLGLKRRGGITRLVHWEVIKRALHCGSESRRFDLLCCFSRFGGETRAAGFERLSCSGDGASDGEIQCEDGEGSKQLSPVSVLELHYGQDLAKSKWHQTGKFRLECAKEVRGRSPNPDGRITRPRDSDHPRREWSHFHSEKREIVVEIEGAIFEEISEEAVRDMLGSDCTVDRC